MARREPLHRLIDELREEDLPAVTRVLQALRVSVDPVVKALEAAPSDDESDEEFRQLEPPPFKIRAFVDGLQTGIDPDKMNQLVDEFEDEEFARKYRG